MELAFDLKKSVLFRFLRGFVAGAVGSMASLVPMVGSSWQELETWLVALGIAGLSGGITGAILAADKYFRSK